MQHYNHTKIVIRVLGAGQTVGRSCVIVELENRRVMFDCGSHLGYKDERKYPNFNILVSNDTSSVEKEKGMGEGNMYEHHLNTEVNITIVNSSISEKEKLIEKLSRINEIIDCVIISHFHMDHIGALPFFTEILKYRGTIIMSYPTKALSPILLLDGCRVADLKWEKKNFERQIKLLNEKSDELLNYNISSLKKDPWNISEEHIYSCIGKVVGLQINETYEMGNMSITPYYAGHVLGACIYKIEVNNFSVIYTGDYNTVPDKHLGSTKIPSLNPEIFISESTYATYVRPTRKASELDLCNLVHECVHKGGKVLIPVFAIGRAQELSILLDSYWRKMKINYPIYFGCGLTENANKYYRIYSSWVNSNCVSTDKKNLFDFANISPFVNNYLDENRPMVLFATPGMLHTGLSLKAFKAWAGSSNNLIVLPGYCVQGTVGHKLIMGERKISFDGSSYLNVACRIIYLSFSAHADSNGIQQLIRHVLPQNVLFVHGEKNGMEKLSKHISSNYLINSLCPSLGQHCEFNFSKGNMKHVYVQDSLYADIIHNLNEQKEKKSLLSTNKVSGLYRSDATKLASRDGNYTVSFSAYIVYFTIREKPYLLFLPRRELLRVIRARCFPVKVQRGDKCFTSDKLFGLGNSEPGGNVPIHAVDFPGEKLSSEDTLINDHEEGTPPVSPLTQLGKRKYEEMSRIGGSPEEVCEDEDMDKAENAEECSSPQRSPSKHLSKKLPKVSTDWVDPAGENPIQPEVEIQRYPTTKEDLFEHDGNPLNLSKGTSIASVNACGEALKKGEQSTPRDTRNYVKNEDQVTMPLMNLRFSESISISYHRFYNFVISFFKEIVDTKNRNSIRFLGEEVIIKNVKEGDGYVFLLSFLSLRAIHDGGSNLLVQWSYVDDVPESAIQKFISSIREYASGAQINV
ncbi:cleavage and polyadenylation specificity factor, putative [Plasmodium knowlesi strain H]|uniref:Cleavage and polyadenylation specificity factor, putative n=3 Tax=Plasmodium knowlesi TaxID=5850 RepID=A0A5K1V2B8_PLAKH|nr:cleavage and polyadenylation specificity factor, putative [Plasmodium knowlesi strain H]OTN65986.1 putative Cleavage and polyadenylation specificity factor [Plasmodium knowlesi]CAA9987871.1 cleavage and polyadenylation specificity factor, putative [Plasmodium knowlesi strain H]SBO22290.1 cleavage and polyadenylation specificity factor, putative [Plasmodium knowlesi strain H]SBO28804.1 cleavage and polyadenylation specificity factor, putative [Plasmodium knowlesi strain H]VVS77345.1 cleavage|eukprot:XP_002258870.1 RNA-metabolising metallo-beta-lactamase,putative [Plasmodium knowlesi strain H]